MSLTSARTITASAHPPRATFLDFPLGHTSGLVDEPAVNREIVLAALESAWSITEAGSIEDLPHVWPGGDGWRDDPMGFRGPRRSGGEVRDARTPRHDTPQYQTEADAAAAAEIDDDAQCQVCVGLDPTHLARA